MDPLSAADAWKKRWGDVTIRLLQDRDDLRTIWKPNPPLAWPYKARAPDDRLSHDRSMWIILRLGPAWSDGQSGEWYSALAWEDNDTVMEFWFKDQEIFTEFTLRWC